MAEFKQKAFFAEIAANLRAKGALKPYAQPLGELSTSAQRIFLKSHKASTGRVRFTGDQPYEVLAHNWLKDVTQQEIDLKRGSLMRAILFYMPHQHTERFINHFVGHATEHQTYVTAVDEALSQASQQLMFIGKKTIPTLTMEQTKTLLDTGNAVERVQLLRNSEICADIQKHPELLLACAMFMAAHKTYLLELHRAINEMPDLTSEERHIAAYTIEKGFSEFKQFQIFSTFLPLVCYNLRTQPGIELRTAMESAWQRMFDKELGMFEATLGRAGEYPKSGDGTREVRCPAQVYLRKMADDSMVSKITDHVEHNKQRYQKWLDKSREISSTFAGAKAGQSVA